MEDYKTKLLFFLIFIILFIFNVWFFFVKGEGSWGDRIKQPLEILTVYTIAFGFLSTTDILKDFGHITEDMTDPNMRQFIAGNFLFLTVVFSVLSIALSSRKTHYSWFYLFETPFLIVLAGIAFAYAIFHVLVVIPISYLAYAMVSVPIRAIQTSVDDMAISCGEQTITAKGIFSSENEVAMRNFMIGISVVVLQIVIPLLLNVASTLIKIAANA